MESMTDTLTPLRPLAKMADVVRIENVWDEPDALIESVKQRTPFNLIYGAAAYDKLGGADPWFRDYWVSEKHSDASELVHHLHNPKLIQAAKRAFKATIVRPQSLCWNLHAPMVAGRPHFDQAPYRGIDRESLPTWLLFVIHHSQLFLPWVVPSTTGLSFFYRGRYGAFEYWPDGPDMPSVREAPPFWNVGVVTDNEFMFHRPHAVGEPERRFKTGEVGNDAKLHHLPGGGWKIVDGEREHRRLHEDEIRFSMVWKAMVFKDEAAEAVFDNHTDDLSLDIVWDVLGDDLKARGVSRGLPAEPMEDRQFRTLLLREYPNPGQHYFPEAKWR